MCKVIDTKALIACPRCKHISLDKKSISNKKGFPVFEVDCEGCKKTYFAKVFSSDENDEYPICRISTKKFPEELGSYNIVSFHDFFGKSI